MIRLRSSGGIPNSSNAFSRPRALIRRRRFKRVDRHRLSYLAMRSASKLSTRARRSVGNTRTTRFVIQRNRFFPDGPSYSNLISTLSECSHIGHSKVRRCSRGASVSMRASII